INRDFKEILTESDIDALLHKDDFIRLPETTRDSLKKMNLNDYDLTILQRNLKALLLY
ncbi:MAG: queG 1, partial [Neobacillus sp.]|nr:queG 1 [Neobacillus sp.]